MPVVEILKLTANSTPAVLTKVCESVISYDHTVATIVTNLRDTAREPKNKAAGLSAPQIGVSKRICIVRDFKYNPKTSDEELIRELILINPVIVEKSAKTSVWWEGCLSIPNKYGLVERFKKIKLTYKDANFKNCTLTTEGDLARTIQHELDHLDGILYTTKVIGKILTEKELDTLLMAKFKSK